MMCVYTVIISCSQRITGDVSLGAAEADTSVFRSRDAGTKWNGFRLFSSGEKYSYVGTTFGATLTCVPT